MCLHGFQIALQNEHLIDWIENQLIMHLENPVRLLRWAIVKVEQSDLEQRFWCEGAYLKGI